MKLAQPNIIVPHNLSRDEITKRIRSILIKEWRRRVSDPGREPKNSWRGYTGTFHFYMSGFLIRSTIFVGNSQIEVSVQLPLILDLATRRVQLTLWQMMKADIEDIVSDRWSFFGREG